MPQLVAAIAGSARPTTARSRAAHTLWLRAFSFVKIMGSECGSVLARAAKRISPLHMRAQTQSMAAHHHQPIYRRLCISVYMRQQGKYMLVE